MESSFDENRKPLLLRRFIGVVLIVYWVALFIGTHMPMPSLDKLPQNSDKGLHFVAYAGLSFLLGLWLLTRNWRGWKLFGMVAALCIGYAIFEELTQIPIADRKADPFDVLADVTGTAIGSALLFVVCNVVASKTGVSES